MGHKLLDICTNFVLRGCIGMGLVYFINMYLEGQAINTLVGINTVTAFTAASLGVPGVGLLYGITFFQIL